MLWKIWQDLKEGSRISHSVTTDNLSQIIFLKHYIPNKHRPSEEPFCKVKGLAMRFSGNFGAEGVIWVMIYLSAIFPLCGVFCFTPPAWATSENAPPSGNAAGLIQEGIRLYETQKIEQARNSFETAEVINPDNKVIPYYLGLIHLEQGRRKEAIEQWKKYVQLAPEDDAARSIRQNITLLLREEAKEAAQKAVATEEKMVRVSADENTVAVTAFKNMGSKNLGPLGKGIAAMIIADLSQFDDLKVVEREKIQALLNEMKLGTSGIVNEKSAPKVGKLLKAKYVTSGTMADPKEQSLQVASVLFDAVSNTPTGFQGIEGQLKEFYQLEKMIACRIIADLGRDCDQAPKAFYKTHTKSLAALTAFSYGLDDMDKEKFDDARLNFQEAVKKDPQFTLAKSALAGLPTMAMLMMSRTEMINSAAANAHLVSGATVGGTGAAATATSSSSGGVGLGTTAVYAGGAIVAGGVVAAAVALTGEDDNGDDGRIAGSWNGSWQASNDEQGGVTLNISQEGGQISGRAVFTFPQVSDSAVSDCIQEGSIVGSLDGNRLTMTISASTGNSSLSTSDFLLNSDRIQGTLQFDAGDCVNTTLTMYDLNKTGDVRVSW